MKPARCGGKGSEARAPPPQGRRLPTKVFRIFFQDIILDVPSSELPGSEEEALALELSEAALADGGGYVLLYRAYMDESGIHDDSPVVSVAGCFTRPSRWQEFTREWKRVLWPTGVRVYHSADCQALEGSFKDWSAEYRDALMPRLLPIIPQYSSPVAVSLVLRDLYDAIEGKPHLDKMWEAFGTPYGFCFQLFIYSVLEAIQQSGGEQRVALFHETNDFKKEALEAYDYLKKHSDYNNNLVGLTFGDKDKYIPLQAADVVAYEASKRVLNPDGPGRRSFEAISPPGQRMWLRYFNKENMHQLLPVLERAMDRYLSSQEQSS